MMRNLFVLLVVSVGIAGCATDRYPITGQECGPDDPVKELDAADCAPGDAVAGGFF